MALEFRSELAQLGVKVDVLEARVDRIEAKVDEQGNRSTASSRVGNLVAQRQKRDDLRADRDRGRP